MQQKPGSNQPGSEPRQPAPINRYAIFFGLAIAGCLLDLASKRWVFDLAALAKPGDTWWLIEPYAGFQRALNTGGLFGMGQGHTRWLAGLSVVALAGIGWWLFWAGAARDKLLTVALGIVVAGILGNLYDRSLPSSEQTQGWNPVVRDALYRVIQDDARQARTVDGKPAVRDWILLRYGRFTWPNFNIADSLLVCGAFLLVWHALRKPPAERPAAAEPTPAH